MPRHIAFPGSVPGPVASPAESDSAELYCAPEGAAFHSPILLTFDTLVRVRQKEGRQLSSGGR